MQKAVKRLLPLKIPEFTAILLGAVISIIVYVHLFEKIFKQPLVNFPERAIGITVLNGIDANLRTLLYCINLIFITLFFFSLCGIFSWINRQIQSKISQVYISVESSVQTYLTLFSLFLLLYGIFKDKPLYQSIVFTLLSVIGFFYLIIGLKLFLYKRHVHILQYFKDYANLTFSLLFSFAFFFMGWATMGYSLAISSLSIIAFLLIGLIVYTLNPFLLYRFNIPVIKARSAYLIASIIFSVIPAIIPLSSELHHAYFGNQSLSPVVFAKILVVTLFITGLALFFLYIFIKGNLYTSTIVRCLIFPIILMGFFLCNAIHGQAIFANFDMFHIGERMILTQQMFSFGKIPFIDILPTHGIMDFFGESLYSFVNGYRGPEMYLWRWIPALAGLLLWYFLLARIISPVFSFLLVFLTPESFLFNDVYRIILIVPFFLLWVIKKPGLNRYLALWTSLVFLFFWRFDFGIIAGLSTLCVLPFTHFLNPANRALSFPSTIKSIGPVFLSGLIIIGGTLTLYGLALFISGYDPFKVFYQIFVYFKIQAPTQALIEAYNNKTLLFLLEYVVSPFTSVLFIVVFLFQSMSGQKKLSKIHLILVWLAIFSLIMTMRTVQRHVLLAFFNPVLSMFLIAVSPSFFSKRPPLIVGVFVLVTFLVFSMFLTNIQPGGMVKTQPHSLIPRENVFEFFSVPDKGSRVIINDSSQFRNFSKFCDQYLSADQTFFDFSNAPMLYVMSDKSFPAFIIPNLYQSADPIQDNVIKQLESLRSKNRLPFVVFKQNNIWDSIDGVPQPIRSYRLSEYIYHNYLPFANVNNYEIWKEQNWQAQITPSCVITPTFRTPSAWKTEGITITSFSSDSLKFLSVRNGSSISGFLNGWSGFDFNLSHNNMIKFRFSCSKKGSLRIYFATDSNTFFNEKFQEIKVNAIGDIMESIIFVNGLHQDERITNLRIEFPGEAEITFFRPQFISSVFIPILQTRPQQFDLKDLPYIWGNFDAKKASQKTEILDQYIPGDSEIRANTELLMPISEEVDKSQGNYLHLIVKAKQTGKIQIIYGKKNQSSLSFNLVPSNKDEHYLIRISSQWLWIHDRINQLSIRPSVDVTVTKMMIRKGD